MLKHCPRSLSGHCGHTGSQREAVRDSCLEEVVCLLSLERRVREGEAKHGASLCKGPEACECLVLSGNLREFGLTDMLAW